MNSSKAVFLDRDGTLNEDSVEYIKSTDEFRLFEFTPRALRIFKRLGFKCILITNQSAIGRGLTSREAVENIHERLKNTVEQSKGSLDGIYYCPHKPDEECDCRKPKTGNIEKAIADFHIDPAVSYFIGDSQKDIRTGAAVGCKTVLVRTGVNPPLLQIIQTWKPRPDFVTENILEAAQIIECLERSRKK